ncbi:AMP-binding protein [Algoriphagus sp. AK58]|uniref:AMP-binding protein n=1 Tax=Algoriphagus sp. AK58 TaxID=1406877 RepID=UPI00164FBA34|nr:AMP-binding protein [Algoriphagus sp. AK58]MBC6365703.1 hypothetical protein [Algoriphagus sp. AK58]
MWDRLLDLRKSLGNQPAILGPERSLSYTQLIDEALRAAAFFQARSLSYQVIGISLESKTEEVICALSVLLSGNAFFFIPHQPASDLLSQVPLGLLVTDRHHFANEEVLRVNWSSVKNSKSGNLDAWWNSDLSWLSRPFCVYATSGTTGKAKYVLHDYISIEEDTLRQIEENEIHSSDRIDFLFASSFSSSLASIFPAFLSGASLIVFDLKESNLKEIPGFWKTHQVSITTLTCSAFRAICRMYGPNLAEFTQSVRFLCLGGEAVLKSDLELVAKYFPPDVTLQLAYASTETRTMAEIKLFPGRSQLIIPHDGFPVRNKALYILGRSDKSDAEGEIEIRSKHICVGYWNDQKIIPLPVIGDQRIYQTGDLGITTSEGGIKLIGRTQSRVKVNGLFVDLVELENEILAQSPHPFSCKVLVLRDARGLEFIAAFLATGSIRLSREEIRHWKSKTYSTRPRQWVFMEQFPLNPHGKIDRKELESMVWKQIEQEIIQESNDLILQTVYAAWLEELGNPAMGWEEDFFSELGGSSLGAEMVMGELSLKLGRTLPTSLIYIHRTIHGLTDYLKEELKPVFPKLDWKKQSVSSSPTLVFVEVGHFDSFEEIIRPLGNISDLSIVTLRYDLYQVLEGESPQECLNKLVNLLSPLHSICLVGISFNGWLAAKIAERLGCSVVILDSPFYNSGENRLLNRNAGSRISYALSQLQAKGIRKALPPLLHAFGNMLVKKTAFKPQTLSLFQRSVEAFLKQSTPVAKLQNVLYVYSSLSMMTSEKDISFWKERAVDNFETYRLPGDHLEACSEKFGETVAQKITDFIYPNLDRN